MGQKYATFDEGTRAITAFYDADIHHAIPDDAAKITDAEWTALLEGQNAGRIMIIGVDGKSALVDRPPPQ